MTRTYTPPLRSANPPGPSGNFTATQVDGIMTGLAGVANAAAYTAVVANSAARLALGSAVQVGDFAVETSTADSYVLIALPASTAGNWVKLDTGAGFANPMTTLGDSLYGGAAGAATRLAGSTSATKKFLTQTGTGSASAAPAWSSIAAGDMPVAVASGASHASGAVPDPGSVAGTSKFLREDMTFATPGGANNQIPWFGSRILAPPVLSGYTWVDQGTASFTQNTGSADISFPLNSGDHNRLLTKAIPATPYTLTMGFVPGIGGSNNSMGLCLYDSVSGKIIEIEIFRGSVTASTIIRILEWTNTTSPGTALFSSNPLIAGTNMLWLRVADTGTTRTWSHSYNGQLWIQDLSHASGTWLTPTAFGFSNSLNDTAFGAQMNIFHFDGA